MAIAEGGHSAMTSPCQPSLQKQEWAWAARVVLQHEVQVLKQGKKITHRGFLRDENREKREESSRMPPFLYHHL